MEMAGLILGLYQSGGGVEIIFPIDFGIYLSIITPSILIQSTRFHIIQTYV